MSLSTILDPNGANDPQKKLFVYRVISALSFIQKNAPSITAIANATQTIQTGIVGGTALQYTVSYNTGALNFGNITFPASSFTPPVRGFYLCTYNTSLEALPNPTPADAVHFGPAVLETWIEQSGPNVGREAYERTNTTFSQAGNSATLINQVTMVNGAAVIFCNGTTDAISFKIKQNSGAPANSGDAPGGAFNNRMSIVYLADLPNE